MNLPSNNEQTENYIEEKVQQWRFFFLCYAGCSWPHTNTWNLLHIYRLRHTCTSRLTTPLIKNQCVVSLKQISSHLSHRKHFYNLTVVYEQRNFLFSAGCVSVSLYKVSHSPNSTAVLNSSITITTPIYVQVQNNKYPSLALRYPSSFGGVNHPETENSFMN